MTVDSPEVLSVPLMVPSLGPAEAMAAAEAVASGWVTQGPRVEEFEQHVSRRTGARHGVAVSSGTTALHLAMIILGVGPGDEVVVPSSSFIATANAVAYTGAEPVFADVDPATFNLTADTVAEALSARTRAVILVHQAGTPADIDAVAALCRSAGIALVEDAACAIGAEYKGRPIGCGDLVTLSFHPRKIITTGEGGMLLTDHEEMAERARRLRQHGMSVSTSDRFRSSAYVAEQYDEVGYNYRLTDIQAAIGLKQMERLDSIVARRRELGAAYREMLSDVPGLVSIGDPPYGRTNYQSFWVVLPEHTEITRDELLRRMREAGVSARSGIMAAHLEPAYGGRSLTHLPNTEMLARRSVILPMFHDMTPEQQNRVVEVFRNECGL